MRTILPVLSVVLTIGLLPAQSFALSCAPASVEEQLATASTVFAGTVRSSQLSTAEDRPERERVITLDVDTVYTGEVAEEREVFVSEDWGPEMVEGVRYLVYGIDLGRDDGILVASSCGSTDAFDRAERGHLPTPLWTNDDAPLPDPQGAEPQEEPLPQEPPTQDPEVLPEEPLSGGSLRGIRAVALGAVFALIVAGIRVLQNRS